MNRTKIEWVKGPNGEPGYTWNPVTGCLHGMRRMRNIINSNLKGEFTMKASEIVSNQPRIEELKAEFEKVTKEFLACTDEHVKWNLENRLEVINEALCHEQWYCGMCAYFDSGDSSVGINEFCDHEVWENEEGDVTDELSGKMAAQMFNSGECPYFERRK